MLSVQGVLTNQLLELAQERLSLAHVEQGRELAQAAFRRCARGSHAQGLAFLILARLDVLDSRMERALRFASAGARCFEQAGDVESQSKALNTIGYAASALKLDGQALQATEDAMAKAEAGGSPLPRADSLNYLGLSQMWAGRFSASSDALQESLWFALDARRGQFQPLVNTCILEVMEHHHQRHVHGKDTSSLDGLCAITEHCEVMRRLGRQPLLNNGTTDAGMTALLEFALAYRSAQRQHIRAGLLHLRACKNAIETWSPNSWLHALAWWARFELSAAQGQWLHALQCAWAMQAAANKGEQRHLQDVALRLNQYAQACLLQG